MDLKVKITYRQILLIALPIAASILVPQVNFITNNIFLSSLGEEQLAVAGITGVFYLIFAVIGFGLNNGMQSLIARRAGEGRINEISGLFNQGIRVALCFSIGAIVVTYFIAPYIFSHTLDKPDHVQIAVHYLYIRIWGLPLLYMYQLRNAMLVGTNHSKYLIAGTLVETVTNIVLDYALIKGRLGLPQVGFNGAAFSSIIAEGMGFLTVFLVMRKTGISKKLRLHNDFSYQPANTKLVLVQSAPLIVQFMISVTSWEFFYILIEHHGERDLAISNTMRNIFGLFGCVSWSFAAASNTMVSNVIGQGLQHRVKELIIKIMTLSVSFAAFIFIVLNLTDGFLLKVYGQGQDFITEAIPVVRVVSMALVIMSISTVWLNAVTGTGNTRINLQIEIGAITLYCIYAYVILEKLDMPITWGWAAEWVYWTAMLIPSFLYIQSGRWKGKKI
ncbi:MAG TPA: MATE family efflux transporter [Chitinophagaceae bacterium]|nr:MATE family efflux transporter [Chitinophagaceae bacterium]